MMNLSIMSCIVFSESTLLCFDNKCLDDYTTSLLSKIYTKLIKKIRKNLKTNQAQKRTSQDDNLNQKKIRKIKTIQAQKKDDRPDHRPPCTICHGHCTWAAARPVSYVSLFIYLIFLFIFLFRFRPISISAAFPVWYVFIYICYFYFHNLIGSLDFGSVQDHLKNLHNSNGIFISQSHIN